MPVLEYVAEIGVAVLGGTLLFMLKNFREDTKTRDEKLAKHENKITELETTLSIKMKTNDEIKAQLSKLFDKISKIEICIARLDKRE